MIQSLKKNSVLDLSYIQKFKSIESVEKNVDLNEQGVQKFRSHAIRKQNTSDFMQID